MAENIHKGHRARLRELVENAGLENLPEHQVLEFLLTFIIPRKDTNPIAHNLIKSFGSLTGVLNANKDDLSAIEGIGDNAALFLSSLKDVFSVYRLNKNTKRIKITCTGEAVKYLKPRFQDKTVEELYVICLDNNSNIVLDEKVSSGTVNCSPVNLQNLIKTIFKSKCTHFLLAHNHPCGKLSPSIEDDNFTKAVVSATRPSNIDLADHIIMGNGTPYSYGQSGQLQKFKDDVDALLEIVNIRMSNVCSPSCKFDVNR